MAVHRRIRSGLLIAALLAGCTRKRTAEDVVGVYVDQGDALTAAASTVLFVPGIMGSELHLRDDPDTVVWGRFGTHGMNPSRHRDDLVALALPPVLDGDATLREDPEVEPGGELLVAEVRVGAMPLRARAYPGVFEGVVEALEGKRAHARALPLADAAAGKSPLYAVGYDWRRSVTAETAWLHQDVLAAVEARRAAGLDPRVDIVAHSLGTQVVRWYLRHGPARLGPDGVVGPSDWDPSRWVRQVVLVAPPNLGEPAILEKLLEGEKPNPMLPFYDPVVTATFPSLFELLPRPREARVVWADDGTAVDLYDVAVWERLSWGAFDPQWDEHLGWLFPDAPDRPARVAALREHLAACLDHARRFHTRMDWPDGALGVPVHVFVGVGHPTQGVLTVDRESGKVRWDGPEDGDGTVARRSAIATSHHTWTSTRFVPADHIGITGSPRFIEDTLYLLLQPADAL